MNLKNIFIELGDFYYYKKLEKELFLCNSVLDVGCGSNSPLRKVKIKKYSVGVDVFKPSIKISRSKKIHDKYKIGNVNQIDKMFKKNSFDAVIALDLIEHLEKTEAVKLLKKMEKIGRKKIIILTPNGFTKQDEHENNPFQVHKSGWNVEDFKSLGFIVRGMRGLKWLRGEHATLRFKPWFFWGLISTLSEMLIYFFPRLAYQLFAVKDKNNLVK